MTTNALAVLPAAELVRQSTDIAGLCKEIVVKCASRINNKKYVQVEGWQAIAVAHGCTASARNVEHVEGGIRAIGEVKRMSDGAVISSAEGFVGDDEPKWANGAEYARRAMAQTRAISRACRSAFAHVVVLMDAGLSTTPAEEVPHGGFDNERDHQQERRDTEAAGNRRSPVIATHVHFGKNKGKAVTDLNKRQLAFYRDNYEAQLKDGKRVSDADAALYAAVMAILKPELPVAGNDADDEIPGIGKDRPHLNALSGMLSFEGIEEEEFMAAAKADGSIPETAKSFQDMTEDTAKLFSDSFEHVKTFVAMYREAQKA